MTSAKKQIRIFDLFCGAGGSSCGARMAGATPVGGVDVSNLATQTFLQNNPRATAFTTDLRRLTPRSVIRTVGAVDLLLASPECTHHSVAKGKAPRDEASRRLAFQVIRFAKGLRPRWLVVENVVQMEQWASFPDWLESLQSLGYRTIILRLNAWDFAVPQTRKRLFVIADRRQAPGHPRTYHRAAATAGSIILNGTVGAIGRFSRLDSPQRADASIERAQRAIDTIGSKTPFIMVYYGSDGSGGWQRLDRPLRTITTVDRFALVRPNGSGHEIRMLQPPELAAAMGFPPTYKWPPMSRRNQIRLIGNAVCPPVMRAIIRGLTRNA